MEDDGSPTIRDSIVTRGYQQEMLDESLRRNIIIAMDTGSGKTHIAMLRLKIETEREPRKISWFFAPNVALCEQQCRVIKNALPVSVGLITGALEPNQWKDASLWQTVLQKYRVVVSTPQVLLDALRHGYIVMSRDISLMVFDEAHHTADKHPYNLIMKEFYFDISRDNRPMIMGLTASPIFGGNVELSFRKIEGNLDSIIVAPRQHRDELAKYVHRPTLKHVVYAVTPNSFMSINVAALEYVYRSLNIEDDPYVKSLRLDLKKATPNGPEYRRLDQKLSKILDKKDSFIHKGLADFFRTAEAILQDVGVWAADWFVWEVIEQAKLAARPLQHQHIMRTWKIQEKAYLLDIISKISLIPPSYAPEDVTDGLSDKAMALIEALLSEKDEAEGNNEVFSCLVFVQRRDVVLALRELLSNHPATASTFRIGSLFGTSESSHRHSMMDITRRLFKDSQDDTLLDFRIGEKNLIVSTAVAEEGIDVQACGCVIRWDPPPNMAAWAQSRGRARKKKSTFVMMFEKDSTYEESVRKWHKLEEEMVARYRDAMRPSPDQDESAMDEDDGLEFTVAATGALLTLQSAIPHLNHFCAVISSVNYKPVYELDPPEYPTGWHSFSSESHSLLPYSGPWGSTVTLPRVLPSALRTFSTENIYLTKVSAHRHVAFQAYKCLYECGFLSEHLLPITDDDEEVKELKAEVEKRLGLVNVAKPYDTWAPVDGSMEQWYLSELQIGELPPLHLFTRIETVSWSLGEGPTLHLPSRETLSIQLRQLGIVPLGDDKLVKAKEYTRMILWSINGSRMDWDNLDFSYLFLPINGTREDAWIDRTHSSVTPSPHRDDSFLANAQAFGEQYHHPTDLSLIRDGTKFQKAYRFVRWRFDNEPLSDEEELQIREWKSYKRIVDLEITFPLLVVEPLPPRTNFLVPLPSSFLPANSGASSSQILLLPRLSSVLLLSSAETQYAFLLPSVLRALSIALRVESFRKIHFTGTPLHGVPNELLTVAMTAPVSQERRNYQRLETLGDTVLKYIVAIQVFDEYPLWPEGYLTKKKDHAVSNSRLAKENMNREIFKWIIRDRMLGKKWKPDYQSLPPGSPGDNGTLPAETPPAPSDSPTPSTSANEVEATPTTAPTSKEEAKKKKKQSKEEMSTKVLADVIESIVGASYYHGGFDLAFEALKFFDLGLKWQPISARMASILRRVDEIDIGGLQFPPQVYSVERIIGYTFKRKLLLVEALTHSSHEQGVRDIMSNERMEFLGDAVLDMIVNDYLYRAPGKEYSPGHIYLRKIAVVNGHILAFICLKASSDLPAAMPMPDENGTISLTDDLQTSHLYKCLLHASPQILEDQQNTWARFRVRREGIENALLNGNIYPWAALTRMQAPKFFADIIESIFGAVFIDSSGDLDAVRFVMRQLGLMQILERLVYDGIDPLHPVSRLSMWAAKNDRKIRYESSRKGDMISCEIFIDEKSVACESDTYNGNSSKEEVRLAAAETAIQALHLRDVNTNYNTLKKRA